MSDGGKREPVELDRWLTRLEAAKRARLSVSTIDRAIAAGELDSRKVHGRRLVLERWLDDWVLSQALAILFVLAILGCVVASHLAGEPCPIVRFLHELQGGMAPH